MNMYIYAYIVLYIYSLYISTLEPVPSVQVAEEVGFDISGHIDVSVYIERQHKGMPLTRFYIARNVADETVFETQTKKVLYIYIYIYIYIHIYIYREREHICSRLRAFTSRVMWPTKRCSRPRPKRYIHMDIYIYTYMSICLYLYLYKYK